MKQKLSTKAKELGFALVGVADPSEFERYPKVSKFWRDAEVYFERPLQIWSEAKSVVVVGLHTPSDVWDALLPAGDSLALFYYEIIHHKFFRLRNWLGKRGCESMLAENISYKRAAILAGLGWPGKNSLVATPDYGSDVRFGVLLTDATMTPDAPNDPFGEGLCAGCQRCILVCTEDDLSEYQLDFSQCLVPAIGSQGSLALRAEHLQDRGEYSVECNLCQKVCPLGAED